MCVSVSERFGCFVTYAEKNKDTETLEKCFFFVLFIRGKHHATPMFNVLKNRHTQLSSMCFSMHCVLHPTALQHTPCHWKANCFQRVSFYRVVYHGVRSHTRADDQRVTLFFEKTGSVMVV